MSRATEARRPPIETLDQDEARAHDDRVTEIHRYLVEEIALDFRDGHLSRREAMRRLLLMGVSAVVAPTLLGCEETPSPAQTGLASAASGAALGSASGSAPPGSGSGPWSPPPPLPASKATEAITFKGAEERMMQAAWAAADKPRGAMLVIHENKGLNDHTRHVAGRFAAAGYSAMAIDLLSEEGGTAALGDPAQATAALGKVEPDRFVADLRASLNELAVRAPGVKLGAVGFCFGGGMTWRLLGSKHPKLAAAIPFYGPLYEGASFAGAKTAVLGIYAEADQRVNASRDAAKAALEKAGLVHEIVTYPGDHAFFNDTGPRFHAESATAAWTKVLEFIGKNLG
jgi:carboxymethylenebutenolidase